MIQHLVKYLVVQLPMTVITTNKLLIKTVDRMKNQKPTGLLDTSIAIVSSSDIPQR